MLAETHLTNSFCTCRLTLAVLPKNKQLAYVSSIAFCLCPPAMFMSSFYTESMFALMTFTGMRWIIEKKYTQSALIWGIASGVRSNAVVYAGFFFYDLVWTRLINRKVSMLKSFMFDGSSDAMPLEFCYWISSICFIYVHNCEWICFISVLCVYRILLSG